MHTFTKTLIAWYEQHQRTLPWRGEKNPYKIWISEIILQQTRIEQGWNYYLQFTERFPDVATLALAEEDEVLKYWQGLGYYGRARHLHEGAKYIYHDCNNIFPDNYEEILKIKGVGAYTAAAIASMAFDLPYAAVDGNGYRVLARVFGVDIPIDSNEGKKYFFALAQQLLDTRQPATFNQAMMDFGALQCKPQHPDCENCCMADCCLAFARQTVDQLPVKTKKIPIKNRYLYYLHIDNHAFTYIHKRDPHDIWAGLYEFPLIESTKPLSIEELPAQQEWTTIFRHCQYTITHVGKVIKHQLTHRTIYAQFVKISIRRGEPQCSSEQKIAITDLHLFPVSRLMEIGIQS